MYSEWCVSAGTGKGHDIDTTSVKTKGHLPYLPGRELKGLIKNALEFYFENNKSDNSQEINFDELENYIQIDSAYPEEYIPEEFIKYILKKRNSQSMNNKGVSITGSLRSVEYVIPMNLSVELMLDDSKINKEVFESAIKLIKCLGSNRNRGNGRCKFSLKKLEDGK